ncbi:alpha/beta hydrolase [Mycolicibacterium sphagni]|uniref:Alpha/beta hydrolase n=1 Tax=Mycolicibacterium sphagni TaxID=1786 RepID=A0A255DWZ8_9MYCO|nr:alpha/beta fold hydrolase [Mycolicibacterium sphagni]OYN81805.1 alpha/beta hydrolase [Mycolicibacterium sphagni]
MSRTDITFDSSGVHCSAWHFPGEGDAVASPSGRPVVVMGHGFGGTKDSGLEPFAERISADGVDVLAFDYRGFGASEGTPRQTVSVAAQIGDFEAAIAAAQRLPGVDPNRIVLWGSSMSGGHVFRVAADRTDVAGVIAMTPLTSGVAVSRAAVEHRDVAQALKWTVVGVKSRIDVARGRRPTLMPLVAHPGEPGALALDGAYESYTAMAGPTWRNEVDSAVGLQIASIRTADAAKRLRCPLLVQIADFDRYVPAESVVKTAILGRGEVHHYPCDHFDVWPGHDWFDKAADDQVAFLRRALLNTSSSPDRLKLPQR